MKDELEFTRYWNDFANFTRASKVPTYFEDPKSLDLFYQYLIARSNQELKEEIAKQNEKMDALTKALSAK